MNYSCNKCLDATESRYHYSKCPECILGLHCEVHDSLVVDYDGFSYDGLHLDVIHVIVNFLDKTYQNNIYIQSVSTCLLTLRLVSKKWCRALSVHPRLSSILYSISKQYISVSGFNQYVLEGIKKKRNHMTKHIQNARRKKKYYTGKRKDRSIEIINMGEEQEVEESDIVVGALLEQRNGLTKFLRTRKGNDTFIIPLYFNIHKLVYEYKKSL